MPPVSRPTVISGPPGRVYVPASVPSARSAVSTTVLPDVGAAGGGADAGFGAAPPRRKPQEPQNLLFGGLMCPHCGQITVPEAAGAAERRGGDRRCRRCRRGSRSGRGSRSRRRRSGATCSGRHDRNRGGSDGRRRNRLDPLRRRLRRERLRCRIARQLCSAAEAELVMVLVLLGALRAGDHEGLFMSAGLRSINAFQSRSS